MPRVSPISRSSSSSSSSSKSSTSKPVAPKSSLPAASPAYHPPASPITVQHAAPSLGQSMKEGFGLGVGMSVARNVVDGLFGSNRSTAPVIPVPQTQMPPSSPLTHPNVKEFQECMERNYNNYDECKTHLAPQ